VLRLDFNPQLGVAGIAQLQLGRLAALDELDVSNCDLATTGPLKEAGGKLRTLRLERNDLGGLHRPRAEGAPAPSPTVALKGVSAHRGLRELFLGQNGLVCAAPARARTASR
jgi:hypothetical protein